MTKMTLRILYLLLALVGNLAAASTERHEIKGEESASSRILSNVFTDEQLELAEQYLHERDNLLESGDDGGHQHSLASIRELALSTRAHIDLNNMLMHRYDKPGQLEVSGGNKANQELCLSQLKQLTARSKGQTHDSRDINFHQLMDTYGRAPTGVLQLKIQWGGLPAECQRLKIFLEEGIISDTSYCLAHFHYKNHHHHNHRTDDDKLNTSDLFSLKTGVCLPKSCDSLEYKDKFQLIEQLIEFNTAHHEKNETQITQLYCLPDSSSTIRSWWRQPSSLILSSMLLAWCSLVVYCTVKLYLNSQSPTHKLLAIQTSFKSLLANSSMPVSLEEQEMALGQRETNDSTTVVNLNCVDGIKVLCIFYVIVGNIQICMTQVMQNLGQMTTLDAGSFLYALLNLMPAHAINALFAITGLLTAYQMFNSNQANIALRQPYRWLSFVGARYLKIMPLYVLVVAYSKYLARFTGSGPMWDYGTSNLAARGRCEQESWLSILLFGANLGPSSENCVPSAWFIANDFQFYALAAPIFMALLHYSPSLGRNLLRFCTAAGCGAAIINIIQSQPHHSLMPHGLFTRYSFLSTTYTWPQFRIPAYLCGLLIGYELHKFEFNKLNFIANRIDDLKDSQATEPRWSRAFVKYGPTLILVYLTASICGPLVVAESTLQSLPTEWLIVLSWPSHHLIFSLALGLYILLAATGYGNKTLNQLLSSSYWKPIARLNLCVLLVHWEVINFVFQSSDQFVYVDEFIHMAWNPILIIYAYSVALVVHLLFEAPIKALISQQLANTPLAHNQKLTSKCV